MATCNISYGISTGLTCCDIAFGKKFDSFWNFDYRTDSGYRYQPLFDIQENEDFDIDEEEITLSILSRYIDESEFDYDKNIIKGIFEDLYRQACEVE